MNLSNEFEVHTEKNDHLAILIKVKFRNINNNIMTYFRKDEITIL